MGMGLPVLFPGALAHDGFEIELDRLKPFFVFCYSGYLFLKVRHPSAGGGQWRWPCDPFAPVASAFRLVTFSACGNEVVYLRYEARRLLSLTMGLRWSHSVAGSPQYAHRTSLGIIPRTRRASSTSLSEGSATGMIPLTNELVIVEVLPAIDIALGILNAFKVARSFMGSFRKEGPQHCYGPKNMSGKIE